MGYCVDAPVDKCGNISILTWILPDHQHCHNPAGTLKGLAEDLNCQKLHSGILRCSSAGSGELNCSVSPCLTFNDSVERIQFLFIDQAKLDGPLVKRARCGAALLASIQKRDGFDGLLKGAAERILRCLAAL